MVGEMLRRINAQPHLLQVSRYPTGLDAEMGRPSRAYDEPFKTSRARHVEMLGIHSVDVENDHSSLCRTALPRSMTSPLPVCR